MLNFIKNPKTVTPVVVFAQFSGTSFGLQSMPF
jgi:hypothetical protein